MDVRHSEQLNTFSILKKGKKVVNHSKWLTNISSACWGEGAEEDVAGQRGLLITTVSFFDYNLDYNNIVGMADLAPL